MIHVLSSQRDYQAGYAFNILPANKPSIGLLQIILQKVLQCRNLIRHKIQDITLDYSQRNIEKCGTNGFTVLSCFIWRTFWSFVRKAFHYISNCAFQREMHERKTITSYGNSLVLCWLEQCAMFQFQIRTYQETALLWRCPKLSCDHTEMITSNHIWHTEQMTEWMIRCLWCLCASGGQNGN